MRKILCFLLTASLLLNSSIIYAETLPQTPLAGVKADVLKDPSQTEFTLVGVPNVPDGNATPLKENADNNKPESVPPEEESKNVKSTELVEVIPDKLDEYNSDTFDEEFDEGFTFSKMQLAKDIAVDMVKSFVHDLKSFAMFYPLIKTSSFITFCAWVFPLYFLYKKTGIDVPGMYSKFAMNNEGWHIFFMNLYNVIPMTLASFMIKYGQEAYFKFKTA